MPATNTITAFYSFSPATPAKSTEVNNNFSIYRGNIIPINTDTQTSSDLTHNLGSLTHRWLGSWHKEWTGETAGSLFIVHGGETSTAFANLSDGVTLDGATTPTGGIAFSSITGKTFSRSSAGAGSTTAFFDKSTLTLQTIGKPVIYNFSGGWTENYTTTTAAPDAVSLALIRDGSTTIQQISIVFELNWNMVTSSVTDSISMPIGQPFIDPSPGQTTRTYELQVTGISDTQVDRSMAGRVLAYELK